jgi:hypothetical protein
MNEQLKKEVGYIDHYNKSLSANRVDDLLLQRQGITIGNGYFIKRAKIYNDASFLDVFHYTPSDKD